MDFTLTMSFLGVAILLTLMPGPDILFVIAQSISQNKKAGIATALGLCSGLIVHITAAALGISALVYQSALAFAVVKYAGAAYLLYLAWQSWKEKEVGFVIGDQKPLEYKALYKKGILMNLLNPKVSLFFLALLPQFVNKSLGHVSLQMFVLGIIFLVQALLIFVIVSVFSEKLRHILLANHFIAKRINVMKGLLLGWIGIQIAFSEK
ncbi:threonine/homoserine/homoserine lactone efflux protein [Anoxybacillus tepidamans]|uniref:Threonine/homoserine/homoserine lactone efflux protein n=1 Tax=Anoxybacteroides tepidamans TaxID=265948 RepID=A0A7W8MW73_9BACL|nr:LysE family translocator [Anoxybacillus tepidamans]MBB5326084.1 threonine/homoserine/homoserine lactone efflux protein [Anoxybacillus tepidamans]